MHWLRRSESKKHGNRVLYQEQYTCCLTVESRRIKIAPVCMPLCIRTNNSCARSVTPLFFLLPLNNNAIMQKACSTTLHVVKHAGEQKKPHTARMKDRGTVVPFLSPVFPVGEQTLFPLHLENNILYSVGNVDGIHRKSYLVRCNSFANLQS